MEIKVACAASLFKETGHDLKGIFNLFYNAVYNGCSLTIVSMHNADGTDYGLAPIADNREFVVGIINSAMESFHPDVEKAASRIAQFNQEYKELKEMSEKINEVSFLTVITRSNKQINAYIKRKRGLENETIDVSDLLNVAYYKFSQVNGTLKQFREGFSRFLENK